MDYKETDSLGKYLTEKGKILPRRITRLSAKDQRILTRLIKKARHAGLLGIKPVMNFEGQAAMLLEGLAERYGDVLPVDHGWKIEQGCLSLLPLFAVLADEKDAERGAAIFHATLVAALADWVQTMTPAHSTVVGSGGCFLNQILARGLRTRLGAYGVHLLEARRMPPNDGGLSLGQAWVAQQHLARSKES